MNRRSPAGISAALFSLTSVLLLSPAFGSSQDHAREQPTPDFGQFQAGPLNSGHYIGALPSSRRQREILFFGSRDGHLFALDLATRKELWRRKGGYRIPHLPNVEQEIRGDFVGSPLIVDGVVYAGATDGRLYATDAVSGKALWVFTSAAEAMDSGTGHEKWKTSMGGTIGAVAVRAGTVFSGAYHESYDQESKRFRKQLVALGAEKGELRWFLETTGSFRSSPTVCADRVFFADDHGVVYCALTRDGSVVWKTLLGDGEPVPRNPTSSPIVWKDRLYIGGSDHNLHCLDAGNGRQLWAFEATGEVSGTPAVATSR